MKKAPWLQLPRFLPATPLLVDVDPLAEYRRQRLVARRSPARMEQERIYRLRVRQWLTRPCNRWCRVYRLLLGKRVAATQCHHFQGRRGMLLLYEPFWIPVSWEGHRWIGEHRERARELGLLCPLGRYNSQLRRRRRLYRAKQFPVRCASRASVHK